MDRAVATLLGLGTLVALGLYSVRAQASAGSSDGSPAAPDQWGSLWGDLFGFGDPAASDVTGQAPPGDQLDKRVRAMLATIRGFESGNDYGKLYGGGRFTDFSHHPNVRVPFVNPATGKQDVSTAAGAYQINFPTYLDFAGRLGLSDFSPATQDSLAIAILNATGAVNALSTGNIAEAFTAAATRWASLPGSTSRQHQQSMQTALAAFDQALALT